MLHSALWLILALSIPGHPQTGAVKDTSSTATPLVAPVTPTSTVTQSPSINPSANNAQQSENGAAAANMAAGAALMAACMATQPPNLALCAMGAAALAQGAEDNKDAGASGNSAANSSQTPAATKTAATPTPPPATPTIPDEGTGQNGFKNATAAGQKALADAGYAVTGAGLTTPDGTTVPTNSLGSSSGMSAAGFSQSQIQDAQKKLADVNAKYGSGSKVSGIATAEGEAGGGGRAKGSNFTLPAFNLKSAKNPFALSNAAKQNMAAGKTVMMDGDPIGVRSDDIFQMIHSCYSRKRERNTFLESTSATGAGVRTPAAVILHKFK